MRASARSFVRLGAPSLAREAVSLPAPVALTLPFLSPPARLDIAPAVLDAFKAFDPRIEPLVDLRMTARNINFTAEDSSTPSNGNSSFSSEASSEVGQRADGA